MDDIGASTKEFEVYSKYFFGNFLFLKYLKPFKKWGPYKELEPNNLNNLIKLVRDYDAKLTIAITACWVTKENELIEFPNKFPEQAQILKNAYENNIIDIANHGLTHCVVGKHLPKLFSSNRKFHREFWDFLPYKIHFNHLKYSQDIFSKWLGTYPNVFVPPGNVMSQKTVNASEKNNILFINSNNALNYKSNIKLINNQNIELFHDRDIILNDISFLEKIIIKNLNQNFKFKFIKDL